MERDFMGLNSKESVAVVKEEASDGFNESAPSKTPGAQWPPYANKVSALPHFMRHMSAHEDNANKTTTASPVASSCFAQNLAGLLGKPSHAPSAASIAGLADPCRNKSVGSATQMTIFYNGTVKVYDSITPEKAQAIMFLAGNGSCLVTSANAQVRPPTSKADATDVLPVNQVINAQPSSAISSPISVSSHNGAQSVSGSTCTDELLNNKAAAPVPFSPDCKMNPPKPMTALGSAAATAMIPRGIPQFRKVSLARFLEKRKERAMKAAPYNGAKKSECAT